MRHNVRCPGALMKPRGTRCDQTWVLKNAADELRVLDDRFIGEQADPDRCLTNVESNVLGVVRNVSPDGGSKIVRSPLQWPRIARIHRGGCQLAVDIPIDSL